LLIGRQGKGEIKKTELDREVNSLSWLELEAAVYNLYKKILNRRFVAFGIIVGSNELQRWKHSLSSEVLFLKKPC